MGQNNKVKRAAGAILLGGAAAVMLPGCTGPQSAYRAEKVTVCHKGRTLVIPENALTAHIGHGDKRGPCE